MKYNLYKVLVVSLISGHFLPCFAEYTTASTKQKANEILNGASVRAMSVSAQIQSGKTDPSLDEFTDNSVGGATFGTSVLKADGSTWATGQDQFAISISSNVDKDVCKQIYDLAGTSGSLRAIYSDGTKLTASSGCADSAPMRFVYNNDLSTTDPPPASCTSDSDCSNGFCYYSQCVEGNDSNCQSSFYSSSRWNGTNCVDVGWEGDCPVGTLWSSAGKACQTANNFACVDKFEDYGYKWDGTKCVACPNGKCCESGQLYYYNGSDYVCETGSDEICQHINGSASVYKFIDNKCVDCENDDRC